MLQPRSGILRSFTDALPAVGQYRLSDVSLEVPDASTAVFRATLHGPVGSMVWGRAWLSNPVDGTLAEAASGPLTAGDAMVLTVRLRHGGAPTSAALRIESAPLQTEHVVSIGLTMPVTAIRSQR